MSTKSQLDNTENHKHTPFLVWFSPKHFNTVLLNISYISKAWRCFSDISIFHIYFKFHFSFVDMVLDNMIASGHLDESMRENVREALLKRHHHQNEKKFSNRIPLVRSFADIGKKHSDPLLLERNGEISCGIQLFYGLII